MTTPTPDDMNQANQMNNMNNMNRTNDAPTSPGPLGYWLRVIDRRLDERMREIFEAEGLTRRDWHRLNLIGGAAADERMAERLASHPEKVAPLIERGWVEGEPGAWRLTEAGETARDLQHERLASLRAEVAGAVGPEEYATTLASLETIARTLGWHEGERMPRGRRRGIRRHFGEHPHGHDEHPHGHGDRHHHRGDRPAPAA